MTVVDVSLERSVTTSFKKEEDKDQCLKYVTFTKTAHYTGKHLKRLMHQKM